MSWKREFGGAFKGAFGGIFEIPGFLPWLVEENVLQDLSHRNEAAPSFGFYDPKSDVEVRLWVDHPMKSRREVGGDRFAVTVGTAGEVEDTWEINELEGALERLFDEIASARERVAFVGTDPEDLSKWADATYYLNTLLDDYWKTR